MKKVIFAVLAGLLSISAFAQSTAPKKHHHHKHQHVHHHHTATAQGGDIVKP